LDHFIREIALNNEYLSLPDCKVLWMTFEQCFQIFIKLRIFDCRRATCILLKGQKSTFSLICVRKSPKTLKNFIGLLSMIASNQSKAQAKDLQKLHNPLHHYEFRLPKFFSKTSKFSIIFYSTWQISGGGECRQACRSRKKESKQSEIT